MCLPLQRKSNGSNLAFGAHRCQIYIYIYNCIKCFANISKCMMIQRLKFGLIVVSPLLNISNSLDHDLWSHNFKKIKKTGLLVEMFNTQPVTKGTLIVYIFLENFMRSTRNQRLIFDNIVVFCLPKRINVWIVIMGPTESNIAHQMDHVIL